MYATTRFVVFSYGKSSSEPSTPPVAKMDIHLASAAVLASRQSAKKTSVRKAVYVFTILNDLVQILSELPPDVHVSNWVEKCPTLRNAKPLRESGECYAPVTVPRPRRVQSRLPKLLQLSLSGGIYPRTQATIIVTMISSSSMGRDRLQAHIPQGTSVLHTVIRV